MEDDAGIRPPPPAPYRPNMTVLEVPVDAVEATVALLRAAGNRECGLFWYGARADGSGIVTSVRVPRQRMTPFNYHVTPLAMSEMGASLADDLRPLAQVHSHPGKCVEHSLYDDEMASSRRALSVVFPNYGRLTQQLPDGVGVHEWQGGYWHLLSPADARARVRLVPRTNVERVDFR
jgi:hypothetical protein